MKKILFVILSLLFLATLPAGAQSDDFRHERKRVWKKWRKNKQSYNPYLDKKKKDKPSAVMGRQNAKELKRQKRMAKRQMRKSKRRVSRK